MIGGAKGIGIGLDFGIGNIKRPTKRDTLDPAIKEALCGVWIADQNTNESPTRNIIKNKIANAGGDFEILNAAYKGNSGYGVITDNILFEDWIFYGNQVFGEKINNTTVRFTNVNAPSVDNFYCRNNSRKKQQYKITGLKDGQSVVFGYTNDIIYTATNNGIHEIDWSKTTNAGYQELGFTFKGDCNITIEQIPNYQGAFCTDGVDDLIVSQKSVSEMLGGSNELTVVSMIHQISGTNGSSQSYNNQIRYQSTNAIRNNVVNTNKTGIYGYSYNGINALNINNILGDKADYAAFKTDFSLAINGRYSVEGYPNNNNPAETSQVAWYWTLIAKRVLTTDEINQVIAYYNLDKYVAPDIYYDIKKQGLTNENHAEFGNKLIDYSGNGKDMQLYNFGWKLDSGVGKYEEYFPLWGKTSTLQIKGHKITINNISDFNAENWILWKFNITSNAFKVNIKGLPKNYNLIYEYKTEGDIYTTQFIIEKDGIYNLDASIAVDDGYGFRVRVNDKSELVNYIGLTIEQLPSFEDALVFDGVDDYGQYVGDLGLKDYTVVADRAYVELKNNGVPFISHVTSTTDTPFLFEFALTDSNRPYSFSKTTVFPPLEIDRSIKYQSSYSYNGSTINRGDGQNTGNGLTFGRFGSSTQYTKPAIYNFMLFPYSLSEFLIERQLKKRKLGTLYPETNNK